MGFEDTNTEYLWEIFKRSLIVIYSKKRFSLKDVFNYEVLNKEYLHGSAAIQIKTQIIHELQESMVLHCLLINIHILSGRRVLQNYKVTELA